MNILYRDQYKFFGFIDLKVFWKDGTVEIIDFKTSEEKDDHSLQMGMYTYGTAKDMKVPVSKIVTGVYYTRYDEYDRETWDKEKLKNTIRGVEKILRKAEIQDSYEKTPNKYCPLCQHRETCEKWNGSTVKA